jgi:hypothetical protein
MCNKKLGLIVKGIIRKAQNYTFVRASRNIWIDQSIDRQVNR